MRSISKELVPSLGNHISGVVCMRPDEQVFGIDAVANVTSMTNKKSFGDFSVSQNPRQSVCGNEFAVEECNPISNGTKGTSKQPTSVWVCSVGFLPEERTGTFRSEFVQTGSGTAHLPVVQAGVINTALRTSLRIICSHWTSLWSMWLGLTRLQPCSVRI